MQYSNFGYPSIQASHGKLSPKFWKFTRYFYYGQLLGRIRSIGLIPRLLQVPSILQ